METDALLDPERRSVRTDRREATQRQLGRMVLPERMPAWGQGCAQTDVHLPKDVECGAPDLGRLSRGRLRSAPSLQEERYDPHAAARECSHGARAR